MSKGQLGPPTPTLAFAFLSCPGPDEQGQNLWRAQSGHMHTESPDWPIRSNTTSFACYFVIEKGSVGFGWTVPVLWCPSYERCKDPHIAEISIFSNPSISQFCDWERSCVRRPWLELLVCITLYVEGHILWNQAHTYMLILQTHSLNRKLI